MHSITNPKKIALAWLSSLSSATGRVVIKSATSEEIIFKGIMDVIV
jgi:hypothetical protein